MSNKCREAFEKSGFSDTGNQWEIWREAYEAAMQERGGVVKGCVHCNPIMRHRILGNPAEGVTITAAQPIFSRTTPYGKTEVYKDSEEE